MTSSELKEWASAFIKNKDLAVKKLVKIEEKTNLLNAVYKDKTVPHHIVEKLDGILEKVNNKDTKVVICPNIEENLNFLTHHWNKFSEINGLTIVFANLKTHDKWVINPKLHAMVADPASIKEGLRAMYDTANGKVLEAPKSKKKASMFEESSNEEDPEEEN